MTRQELQMGEQMAEQKPRWALGSGRQTAAELQGIIHALTGRGPEPKGTGMLLGTLT